MPFILTADAARRPRVLIINPNATEAVTESLHASAGLDRDVELDFYTAPAGLAPPTITNATDSVLSAAACLRELASHVDKWDGFVVACFSAHPLTAALRELTCAPVVGCLEAPLLLGSTLGSKLGILTTFPRWEAMVEQDVQTLRLGALNSAGVASGGLTLHEAEELSPSSIGKVLCAVASDVLQDRRGADVIVLGCMGEVGLETAVRNACRPGTVVLDPFACSLEMCLSLVRVGGCTSKAGLYAPV